MMSEATHRYLERRRQLGIKRESCAIGCHGFARYSVRCNNSTTNEPPYCRAHIEQAPGGKHYIGSTAKRRRSK